MRPLRTLGTVLGLAVAVGVLAGRAALTPVARRAVVRAQQDLPAPEPAIPASASVGVRRARLALGAAGLAVLLLGGWKVLHAVQPPSYVWLAVWLLGAILLNDLVIAPVVIALRGLTHHALRGLPDAALAWLKGGFVVGGVLVLVVVPEIWAQHLGTANPTVLPGDYAGRLLVVLAVVAGLTLAAVAVATARARRPRRT
ncbi:hypothetical protein GCM10022197_35350 [Microlunatus spumicola]|uniref:Uncharacterized protein n=1 Tax=Microlunatus spumicola TaxID=81499 RepID=A0ABP6Y1I6_9ACTN